MPDGVEHATGILLTYMQPLFTHFLLGLEKYELLAKQAGNEDPFFLKAVQRGEVCSNF